MVVDAAPAQAQGFRERLYRGARVSAFPEQLHRPVEGSIYRECLRSSHDTLGPQDAALAPRVQRRCCDGCITWPISIHVVPRWLVFLRAVAQQPARPVRRQTVDEAPGGRLAQPRRADLHSRCVLSSLGRAPEPRDRRRDPERQSGVARSTASPMTCPGRACRPPNAPPTPACRLDLFPVQEVNGFIFAWFDTAAREPRWRLPAMDEAGWTPTSTHLYRIRSPPAGNHREHHRPEPPAVPARLRESGAGGQKRAGRPATSAPGSASRAPTTSPSCASSDSSSPQPSTFGAWASCSSTRLRRRSECER